MNIYIDTSIFKYYFEHRSDFNYASVQLFKEIRAGLFKAYTSEYVIEELNISSVEIRDKMLRLISEYNLTILSKNDLAITIANSYIEHNIISSKYINDAIHIAIASINKLDCIISLSYHSIVRDKTRLFSNYIDKVYNLHCTDIEAPMSIVDMSDNINESDAWIDKIRLEMYEQTKNMSYEEMHDYFRNKFTDDKKNK
jgi:predicted nucleic acid-binding protein